VLNLQQARCDVMLNAICAIAETLPAENRRAAAQGLMRRMSTRMLPTEATDVAVAADLARILSALGSLPLQEHLPGAHGSPGTGGIERTGQGGAALGGIAALDRAPY
jgi:hypothetical protein